MFIYHFYEVSWTLGSMYFYLCINFICDIQVGYFWTQIDTYIHIFIHIKHHLCYLFCMNYLWRIIKSKCLWSMLHWWPRTRRQRAFNNKNPFSSSLLMQIFKESGKKESNIFCHSAQSIFDAETLSILDLQRKGNRQLKPKVPFRHWQKVWHYQEFLSLWLGFFY